ncbi:hypothetical protein LLG46_09755 [bacterium]|nr:hypothetical protein [bacterium]
MSKSSDKTALFLSWIFSISFCIGVLLICTDPLFAWPTSLNLIPIADTIPSGGANLGFATTVTYPSSGSDTENLVETEFGIGGQFEFGFDPVVGAGASVLVNGKYRFHDESRFTPAIAIGMQNVATDTSSMPFITARKTLSFARVHFGTIVTGGTFRLMLGIDKHFGRQFTIQSDYMSGSGNWATLGFVAGAPTGWSLNAAWLIGNSDSSGSGYTIDLEWGGGLW